MRRYGAAPEPEPEPGFQQQHQLPERDRLPRTASATRRELLAPNALSSRLVPTLSMASPSRSPRMAASGSALLPARSPRRSSSPARSTSLGRGRSTAYSARVLQGASTRLLPGDPGYGNHLRLRADSISRDRSPSRSRSPGRSSSSFARGLSPRRTVFASSPLGARVSSPHRSSSLAQRAKALAEGHSPTRATMVRSHAVGRMISDEVPPYQQSESRDKLRALIADLNERALSPDRSPLARLARSSASPQRSFSNADGGSDDTAKRQLENDTVKRQLEKLRSAQASARTAEEIATMEEQALEIERLRAWLASAKETEENERSLRLELQQRAFEEVAAATAAAGIAEAEQRRREMETDSRQAAEWRLAVAQHQLVEAEKQLGKERARRRRLQEQEVVVVDHFGKTHQFYPYRDNQLVTDSEWESSEAGPDY